MTATDFISLKSQVPALTERQRLELSAMLHRQKQSTTAWKKEMARRMAEMDAGKKFPLSGVMPLATNG